MTEEQLKALLEVNIEDSFNHVEGDVEPHRKKAMEYYLRENYGNEVKGKSGIVTGEVAEAVDGALPQLLKVFTQSVDVVEFSPTNDGDATVAENVTQYVNHIFQKDNSGAIIMHNWFWDSLVNKVGVVKAYWDVKEDANEEILENKLLLQSLMPGQAKGLSSNAASNGKMVDGENTEKDAYKTKVLNLKRKRRTSKRK